jgi:hypothetical protein
MLRRLYFTARGISAAPAAGGAYLLYRGARPVYAGVAAGAATLRKELRSHLRGEFGHTKATHFSYQVCADPLRAYAAQLEVHARWDLRAP